MVKCLSTVFAQKMTKTANWSNEIWPSLESNMVSFLSNSASKDSSKLRTFFAGINSPFSLFLYACSVVGASCCIVNMVTRSGDRVLAVALNSG